MPTPSRGTSVRGAVTVAPFARESGGEADAPLRRLVPGAVLERWRAVDRSAHAPRLVTVVGDDGGASAAALVTARPGTAYLKIVDAVGEVPSAVAAVVAHAREQGLAQVKWEGWTADPETAAAAGFTPLDPPHGRAPDAVGPETGHVRWLTGGPASEPPPYYGQTTRFTCGAVTALVALSHLGALPRAEFDRRAELTLWRAATNFPACEPVGLGVAVRRTWPSSPVAVHLDADGPVLLDHLAGDEREWRAVLQRASRADAAGMGVPVDPERLTVAGIRDAVGRGERVLLLVSLAVMQGFAVPHWVVCHGVVPGAVLIDDPWSHAPAGDTWVDAHLLPVPDGSLDTMSTLGEDGFRGAVRIGPARPVTASG
ncbi:peptidase C39 family protein [Streptomyces sp. NPDC101249]|uniref:peptidase C39 family protein n=1 Tax=Streptomyces sp. NPDC101249 TaxID=3366140 RepID=UPI003816C009